MMKSTVIVLFCIISILTGFMLSSKAIGIWHLIHLVTMPEDLFSPIINSTFGGVKLTLIRCQFQF